MSSFLADTAEDVKNLLAAHDQWSETITPTRDWIDYVQLEELGSAPRVAVVPVVLEHERATRGSNFKTATVDVIVQERVGPNNLARIDALAGLVEQIFAFFEDEQGRKLPNVNGQLVSDPTLPLGNLIDQDAMKLQKVFFSVVRTEWQTKQP